MALAFCGAQLPHVSRRTHFPTTCCGDAPRARRLSLPTLRERRFLADNYVERSPGRAKFFARATAFTLSAWPLVVRPLSEEEERRKEQWRRRAQNEIGNGHIVEDPAIAAELTDEIFNDNDASEIPLSMHDSLLLEDVEVSGQDMSKCDGITADKQAFDFMIPPWAYIVRVRAGKSVIGKRAVQRNRAKRRIRAAASEICPNHASRGREYVFSANPEVLTIDYHDLVTEVCSSLKKAGCWEEEMTIEMLRRERYNDK